MIERKNAIRTLKTVAEVSAAIGVAYLAREAILFVDSIIRPTYIVRTLSRPINYRLLNAEGSNKL